MRETCGYYIYILTYSPITPPCLTLIDLERSKSWSLRFGILISCNGAELGHMLLLNFNRKAYMGSPLCDYIWSWLTLKGRCQGHSDFWKLISRSGAGVGHMLLLDTNRKPYMGSPMILKYLTFNDLERSKLRCWKWSKMRYMHGEVLRESWPKISIVLVCRSEFLRQVCRKLPFAIPTAVVKQRSKVHGPLVSYFQQPCISTTAGRRTKRAQILATEIPT